MGVPQIRCLVGDLEVILGLAALMKIDQMNMADLSLAKPEPRPAAWQLSVAQLKLLKC